MQFSLTAVMLLLTEERIFFSFSLGGNLKTYGLKGLKLDYTLLSVTVKEV